MVDTPYDMHALSNGWKGSELRASPGIAKTDTTVIRLDTSQTSAVCGSRRRSVVTRDTRNAQIGTSQRSRRMVVRDLRSSIAWTAAHSHGPAQRPGRGSADAAYRTGGAAADYSRGPATARADRECSHHARRRADIDGTRG